MQVATIQEYSPMGVDPYRFARSNVPASIAPRQQQQKIMQVLPPPTTASQVVVPSMPYLPSGPYMTYYPSAYYHPIPPTFVNRPLIFPPAEPAAMPLHPPIHRTLENATITYDTVTDTGLQKDLVKDVFFSPAMAEETRDCSSQSSSSDSEESDDVFSASSPHVTPSDHLLLTQDDPLFFIGLDFPDDHQQQRNDLDVQLGKRSRRSHHNSNNNKKAKMVLPRLSADDEDSEDDDTLTTRSAGPVVDPVWLPSLCDPLVSNSDDDNESTSTWEDDLFGQVEEQDTEEEDDDEESYESSDGSSDEDEFIVRSSNKKKRQVINTPEPPVAAQPEEAAADEEGLERTSPRPTAHPTIYQKLTKANVDWCRYCGTTEGVNWRPGPWGKRTLCNKHGCDYKGYGFACKLPRLDLTGFAHESIHDRDRPVLQLFCSVCQRQESWKGNVLVRCEGCPRALHQRCCQELTDDFVASDEPWFCDPACRENAKRKRIVVELPRKRLPLMCTPKNITSTIPSEGTRTRSSSSGAR